MLQLAQDPDADALLDRDPLALLIGMLLDQQVPMERAFAGPAGLARRLGVDRLDAAGARRVRPRGARRGVHRAAGAAPLPRGDGRAGAGARRAARRQYDGDAAGLWRDVPDGATLLRRLKALPGFGAQKAQIFVALLGKQRGVTRRAGGRPPGRTATTGRSGRSPMWSTGRRSSASGSPSRRPRPRRRPPPRRSRLPTWTRGPRHGGGTIDGRGCRRRLRVVGAGPHRREAIVSHPQRRTASSSPTPS